MATKMKLLTALAALLIASGRRHDFPISNTLKHNKHHATCSTTIVSL